MSEDASVKSASKSTSTDHLFLSTVHQHLTLFCDLCESCAPRYQFDPILYDKSVLTGEFARAEMGTNLASRPARVAARMEFEEKLVEKIVDASIVAIESEQSVARKLLDTYRKMYFRKSRDHRFHHKLISLNSLERRHTAVQIGKIRILDMRESRAFEDLDSAITQCSEATNSARMANSSLGDLLSNIEKYNDDKIRMRMSVTSVAIAVLTVIFVDLIRSLLGIAGGP